MRDEARLTTFIRGASRLPVLPRVTIRLLETLDAPDASSKDIAAIIEADPSLTARLLKLANSSFYGHRRLISRIDSATTVLGLKTIRSLALAVWTQTLRSRARNTDELQLVAPLLTHGLATAIAARMLAGRVKPGQSEDAFMAGLLHDIGRVALVAQMGSEYQNKIVDPAQREAVPLHEMEGTVLGFDHSALGAALMDAWALPPFLSQVVDRHHDPEFEPEDHFHVAAVALADDFATRLGYNIAHEAPRPGQRRLLGFFGFADEHAVTEFLAACLESTTTLVAILESGD